jgi:hypothetical protein
VTFEDKESTLYPDTFLKYRKGGIGVVVLSTWWKWVVNLAFRLLDTEETALDPHWIGDWPNPWVHVNILENTGTLLICREPSCTLYISCFVTILTKIFRFMYIRECRPEISANYHKIRSQNKTEAHLHFAQSTNHRNVFIINISKSHLTCSSQKSSVILGLIHK